MSGPMQRSTETLSIWWMIESIRTKFWVGTLYWVTAHVVPGLKERINNFESYSNSLISLILFWCRLEK